MPLILRRANVSRKGGPWSETDFDVFDGDRNVGRVYRVDDQPEVWFLGRLVPAHGPQELRSRADAR